MGVIGGSLGYQLLRHLGSGRESRDGAGASHEPDNRLERLFGSRIWPEIKDKVVIDFGCGSGTEAVEVARHGARRVIGIDIREEMLEAGREAAIRAGVAERCSFGTTTREKAHIILSLDAFEHFADPSAILETMRRLVEDDGAALVAFGPTWYHPRGGHLFSVFPWAHLIFTEEALIRWRSDFKTDDATRFSEVEGGLNGMTIHRFESLVERSEWEFASFELVPIRALRYLLNRLTREFVTSVVRCRLTPRRRP